MSNFPKLTAAQMAQLTADINGGTATRANFYIDYAAILQPIDPQAATLILNQAEITTYSGTIGGAALYGNFLAKLADPVDYTNNITLDGFSYDIVKGIYGAVLQSFTNNGSGILAYSDILNADLG